MFVGMKNRYLLSISSIPVCSLIHDLKHSRLLVIQVDILGFDSTLDATVFQDNTSTHQKPETAQPGLLQSAHFYSLFSKSFSFSSIEFLQLEKVVWHAADTYLVFHQESGQLLAIHQANGPLSRLLLPLWLLC